MEVKIRQEKKKDFLEVFNLISKAFEKEKLSDHQEQHLVERLRKSNSFIPELSLVAESKGKILGHILLTPIQINSESETFESLALAPVSVLPAYQSLGIGGKLIEEAHSAAINSGFGSIVLLGHPGYYPRFGYQKAEKFGIKLPFDVPSEYCMALELFPCSLQGVSGNVEYPSEFFQ